ncbi:hypothetical protein [Elstera litoralis]|uniref:hypothetical protein n=1 Tax=Elstera litoralis TaxID=552518 RepID=UPI002FC3D423
MAFPDLRVIVDKAPKAFADLPPPDAIFVGGGGPEVIAAALEALPPGRRLVVNAVTLESQAAMIALHGSHGGELMQIQLAKAGALGGYTGWEPARPQLQWRFEKPS